MPLLIIKLMEEFKRENTMTFKTRFGHCIVKEALLCIMAVSWYYRMLSLLRVSTV